ncbi:MAG: 50S ribosomal protein L11 methyltransferase [Lysobacterales bacterium]
MPFLEFVVHCDAREHTQLEDALMVAGALSVTLLDADAGTPAELAVLEPGVGETPLWPSVELHALFNTDADKDAVTKHCSTALGVDLESRAVWRVVADQAWERVWLDDFKPMRFGRRTYIVPGTHALPTDAHKADTAVVRLDPGLAFGTGTHATTALCLEWLDGLALTGATVADIGCGSGVLAIAALKLGAAHAIGIDNDPQALTASRDNAERNEVSAQLELKDATAVPHAIADAIVANILAGTLVRYAAAIVAWGKPGAAIALSGVLPEQAAEVAAAFAPWCGALGSLERDGWVRLSGKLHHSHAGGDN